MRALDAMQTTAGATDAAPASSPYSTRTWSALLDIELQPRQYFWGNAIALGQLGVIFGQGGLGKSRMALNIARNQVLGQPFAGLPTGEAPLRHLLMGSENSIHRLHADVVKMSANLSQEQIALLGSHITLATLEQPDDSFITMGSPTNMAKWRATLEDIRPNVLWVDPWGDLLEGDINSEEDTRTTLRTLLRLVRQVNPQAACIILAHARTGAKNIAQAIGYDAANFGKGNKAIFSTARSVWNLAPGDESEDMPIVIYHAKNNDGPKYAPRAIRLNPETMLYEVETGFDFEKWREEVLACANGKGKGRAKIERPLEEYRQHVAEIVREKPLPAGVLEAKIREKAGVSVRTAKAIMEDALHSGTVAKTGRLRERGGRVLYGLPVEVDAIMQPELNLRAVDPVGSLGS